MRLLDEILFILCTVAVPFVQAKVPDSLRMVHYLFRHGDRSPTKTYPGDLVSPAEWHKGWGQLSNLGMQQQYHLGAYMRKRYEGFLSDIYSNSEIHVRSTDWDRTLMSALSHLAGLYPPKGEDEWMKSLSWQPIPVHTVPADQDWVLRVDNCPRRKVLQSQIRQLPYFQNLAKKYEPFVKWISAEVGREYTVENIGQIAGPLYIEYLNTFPLPKFVNESVVEKLHHLHMIGYKVHAFTLEAQRISGGGGPLVKDMIERLNKTISGESKFKLYIYSGHDDTVASFLHSIQSFNDILPPFAATVIVELHEMNKRYHLQFWYKNETDHEPYALEMPGCGFHCSFEEFVQLTRSIIPEDVEAECQLDFGQNHYNVTVICLAVLSGFSIVMIFLLSMKIRKLISEKESYVYSQLADVEDEEEL